MMRWLVENTRLLLLLIALIVTAGLSALNVLPRTEDPQLISRYASVITYLPGASAERIEVLINEPLENQLATLSAVKLLTSSARPGLSLVQIELDERVTEVAPVWSKVRDKLSALPSQLPRGASVPALNDEQGYPFTRLINLSWRGPGEPQLDRLARYSAELERRARMLEGTEFVERIGAPQEEITINVDPLALASSGLSVPQLAERLAAADVKGAAGELHGAQYRWQVELAGAFTTLARLRDIPIRTLADGQSVRLADIAQIERGLQNPPAQWAFADGAQTVVVGLRMAPDQRIDRWSARVDTMLANLAAELPDNIALSTRFDQAHYTAERLDGLGLNLLQGFVLIFAVLLVSLGLKAAIIVALSLPLTVAFTFACMQVIGLPIHQMSVTGLVVALGIMVDNAIVMADRVQTARQQGRGMSDAALEAIRHLWLPLLGSTLTTVLAFMPIILLPGAAGEFVSGIALAVICALVGSYLVAHLLVASLAARWLGHTTANPRWYHHGGQLLRTRAWFARTLQLSLQRPWHTLALASLLPLLGFVASTHLTEQFFPPADRNMLHIEASLSPFASLNQSRDLAQAIQRTLATLPGTGLAPGALQQDWVVGDNVPSFYYNLVPRQKGRADYAQGMLTLPDAASAKRLLPVFQRELDQRFPQAQIIVRGLEQGPPFNAPIEVRLFGPELDTLHALGLELRARLSQLPAVRHTRATLQAGAPSVQLTVDEGAALASGLSLAEVAAQLSGQLDGALGARLIEGTEAIPVRVRLAAAQRSQISDVLAVTLPAPTAAAGHPLTLAAMATPQLLTQWQEIPRRGAERVNVVEAYLAAEVLPQTVLRQLQADLAANPLPLAPAYRLEFGGETAERDESVNQLLAHVSVVAVALVAVLVLSFNSFRLAGIVLLVGVQAAGLGIGCVWLAGYPFGFNVIIALLGLVGLAINAAIVLLCEFRSNPLARAGDKTALADEVLGCSRHILSTTVTTVGGFLPLLLGGGGFWPPFAMAMAGGTLLTTLLSFYFVPNAFRLLYVARHAVSPKA
ncbi:MAG: efflux RND transporter permease subunit [Aeromonas sp.]